MALTESVIGEGARQGNARHVGVTGTVIAIAELMVALDATVLGIALADLDAGTDGVKEQSESVVSPLGT